MFLPLVILKLKMRLSWEYINTYTIYGEFAVFWIESWPPNACLSLPTFNILEDIAAIVLQFVNTTHPTKNQKVAHLQASHTYSDFNQLKCLL